MLEKINSPADLRSLTYPELDRLCAEIREYLIDVISKNGGHLASNLGMVELTVALNRVYHAEKDRILFDVGHQCYTHKIINGRREEFATLRQFNGISGFPKPHESEADPFIAGHASDSVSAALGMAKARTILGESYDVCAVIGDGALTGGLAYEGIENVAASMEPIVIILNDNAMSISSNVGAMSSVLRKMRLSEGYYDFKKKYRAVLGINSELYRFGHKVKEGIKEKLFAGNMFTALGMNYLGPVDGHDVKALENAIRCAKAMGAPVLLHVITSKGKGCDYAEAHPENYHGVGPFDKKTGKPLSTHVGYSDVMGNELCALAEHDVRITAITAAMADGTGLFRFSQYYPKRFFDVGIAEEHAVSFAAGMAKQGMVPVFAVYSSFLQRAYDMLIHDVALQQLHVVFCVDRAGIVGNDGETHNGVFDLAYLSSVPGMTIFAPASFAELRYMLTRAVENCTGPVALRYPRGGESTYKELNKADECRLQPGDDITVVCYGEMTPVMCAVAAHLKDEGIHADVIKLGCLCPNSFALTAESLKKTGRLLIAEAVADHGCIGRSIESMCVQRNIALRSSLVLNLGDGILPHGSVDEVMHLAGIDEASILAQTLQMLK